MENNNESNVRFSDLLYLFVSKLWIMILVAVLVGGGLFALNFFTFEPQYKSTASMYILRQSEQEEKHDYSSDFNVALNVVNDCKELLTTHKVLDNVIEKEQLPYTYDELVSMIEINNEKDSRLLEITVVSESAQLSQQIVNSICEVGEQTIDKLVGYDQINTHDKGTLEQESVNSRISYTAILGAIVAFMLTYIVIVLMYIFDDRISDPDLAEKHLQLPVLALIPNMKNDKASGAYIGKTATKRQRYYAQHWRED